MISVDNNLADKIRRLRESLGLTQAEFARLLKIEDQSTISKWERGKQEPNSERNARLAELAGVSVGEWLGIKPERPREVTPVKRLPLRTYRVIGEVRAGDWKEAIEWPHDDQWEVTVSVHPELPELPMKGFLVRGNSMNQYYPDGSLVFVASTISNGLRPRHGNKVLVSRRNADGLYEATIKEYVVKEDGTVWLWPRSYDPEHQAPIPFVSSDTEEVTVTGVVMASFIMEAVRQPG